MFVPPCPDWLIVEITSFSSLSKASKVGNPKIKLIKERKNKVFIFRFDSLCFYSIQTLDQGLKLIIFLSRLTARRLLDQTCLHFLFTQLNHLMVATFSPCSSRIILKNIFIQVFLGSNSFVEILKKYSLKLKKTWSLKSLFIQKKENIS